MAKILLVEDDSNLREIFEMRLQAEGYTTVTAGDGEEGLTVAVREKPDLIISDVMMPKISGFEMLENLRAAPEMKDTRVIMMTALGQAEDQARGDKLGVVKYLVKSQVTLEDFARVVHEVLGDAQASAKAPGTPDESGPSTNNKPEREANMPDDATNPTPTNPAPTSGQPDSGAPVNPISGGDQQTSSQEQGAVQDQINSFVASPGGAPDMAADSGVPAPTTPADPTADSGNAGSTTSPTPAGDATGSDIGDAPSVPPATDAPAPETPATPPADGSTPPADASAPAEDKPTDPSTNAI